MIQIFTFNPFQEHTMVASLPGRDDCVVIDPGACSPEEKAQLGSYLEEAGLTPSAILLTHAHMDHIGGVADLVRKYGCPVYLSEKDRQELDYNPKLTRLMGFPTPESFDFTDIRDGLTIGAAGFEFKAIATPGHTEGGMCYLEEKQGFIFTGDTLFRETIGRTDFKWGDYDALISSIMNKLIVLDAATIVYPGHGPSSTIGHERSHNPMLEPFNEPEPDFENDNLQPIILHNA